MKTYTFIISALLCWCHVAKGVWQWEGARETSFFPKALSEERKTEKKKTPGENRAVHPTDTFAIYPATELQISRADMPPVDGNRPRPHRHVDEDHARQVHERQAGESSERASVAPSRSFILLLFFFFVLLLDRVDLVLSLTVGRVLSRGCVVHEDGKPLPVDQEHQGHLLHMR